MFSAEFPLDPGLCYLNHAAVAPWPTRTTRAVQAFAEENNHTGSRHYERWLATERDLREGLRQLINATSTDEIALLKNTSEALSVVAHGLDWSADDEVVISHLEFPSNRIVWESLARYGVKLRIADLYSRDNPEQALLDCLTDRTRLLSVSSVQYGNGLRLDLPVLGKACRERNILFCVDAIQSIGTGPFDVQAIQADFVMADGHKWMLGPEGLALFYCRRERLESLRLNQFGWHMVAAVGDFDRKEWAPSPTATRFECGSPNLLCAHALHASIGLLLEVGMEQVAERIHDTHPTHHRFHPGRTGALSSDYRPDTRAARRHRDLQAPARRPGCAVPAPAGRGRDLRPAWWRHPLLTPLPHPPRRDRPGAVTAMLT
jgi:cysteine desulfurase / selenocysteine lyase